MRKLVGKVTVEEKDSILSLFERKNGLAELARIIGPENDLYEKLVTDMGKTAVEFQGWWDRMYAKYQWETQKDAKWSIDFSTCEIYLSDED